MLYCNLFRDGRALLGTAPQGDAAVPVNLPDEDVAVITGLLMSPEVVAAQARLFLAGATAGERAVSRGVRAASYPSAVRIHRP